jgi:hypothetical protein
MVKAGTGSAGQPAQASRLQDKGITCAITAKYAIQLPKIYRQFLTPLNKPTTTTTTTTTTYTNTSETHNNYNKANVKEAHLTYGLASDKWVSSETSRTATDRIVVHYLAASSHTTRAWTGVPTSLVAARLVLTTL